MSSYSLSPEKKYETTKNEEPKKRMEEIVIEGREEHDMLRENGEEAIEDS
jgi:hypothetical protein